MVVSPWMVGLSAKMISWTWSFCTRLMSDSIFNWSGPIPSSGEITPPKTWYVPLNCWVLSMAITSRIFSTTQMICFLREILLQILQTSVSDTLQHLLQNFISLRMRAMVSANSCVSSCGCLIRWSTKRNAVFLPIPGSLENSFTACSNKDEEKDIQRKYEGCWIKTASKGKTVIGDREFSLPVCLVRSPVHYPSFLLLWWCLSVAEPARADV